MTTRRLLPLWLVLITLTVPLRAAHTWVGDLGTNWTDVSGPFDTNWDTDTLPANGDDVVLRDTPAGTLVYLFTNGPTALGSLDIGDSTYSFDPPTLVLTPLVPGGFRPSLGLAGPILIASTVGSGQMRLSEADLTGHSLGIAEIGTSTGGFFAENGSTVLLTGPTFVSRATSSGYLDVTDSTFETESLYVADSQFTSVGSVNLVNAVFTVTNRFEIGRDGSGDLSVGAGSSLVTRDALVGVNLAALGALDLTASTWALTGSLRAGLLGNAEVAIGDNGSVTITSPPGNVSVWIGENTQSVASVSIQAYGDSGANITANHHAIVGYTSTNASLLVGGSATFSSGKAASGSGSSCLFGGLPGSFGRGTVENSANLIGDGDTVVGFGGSGFLLLTNGGHLSCSNLQIAREITATGLVLLASYATADLSGGAYIGGSTNAPGGTNARLLVTDYAALNARTEIVLYPGAILDVTNTGYAFVSDAYFPDLLPEHTLTLWSNGTLRGVGTLQGHLQARSGTVAPGLSAGQLTVTGDARLFTSAVLRVELAGTNAGSAFDVLRADTSFHHGGYTLQVRLTNSFTPAAGQTFRVVHAPAYTGSGVTFDFSAAPLPGGLAWNTSTFLSDGTLRITATATPTNVIQLLAIQRIPATPHLQLTALGTNGAPFRVQSSDTLLPGTWTNLIGPLSATGFPQPVTITNSLLTHPPRRFFRLIQPGPTSARTPPAASPLTSPPPRNRKRSLCVC